MTEVYKKSDRVYFDKLDIWHILSNQTNFYEKNEVFNNKRYDQITKKGFFRN